MTIGHRLVATLVVLTLAVAGVVALRPTGTTLAAWSDEVVVPVPTLHTGSIRMDVTTTAGDKATVGMAGDATGTWRPTGVRATAEGRELSGSELTGSRVDYRLASSGGTCPSSSPLYTATFTGSSPVAQVNGGEQLSGQRTLCLTFVPSDTTRVHLGGASLSLATTLDGVAPATTWTASNDWQATQKLAPAPSVGTPSCSAGFLNQRVTLRWDWDRAGLNQDVTRWSLQVQDGGTWTEVRSLSGGQRSTNITPYEFSFIRFDTYKMRVAAVLPDGTTIASAPSSIRVERLALGAVYCA